MTRIVNNSEGGEIVSRGQQQIAIHNNFWQLVEDCLVEFHHFPRPTAREAALEVRHRVETAPLPDEVRDDPNAREFIYHSEPFDIASEISRQKRTLADSQIREKYTAMVTRQQATSASDGKSRQSTRRAKKRAFL